MDERYFYHSFPRRGSSTEAEIDKGCKILASIRDFGLLLTPQLIEWQQPALSRWPRIADFRGLWRHMGRNRGKFPGGGGSQGR